MNKLPPPTPEFLEELRERARRYGWSGDYIEVADFVQAVYGSANITITNSELEPYEICAKCDKIEPECECVR